MEERYEKSCGAVIYNDGKFLLIKHNAGHWAFPKGHVENDETEEQTALREIKEETNLIVKLDTSFRYVLSYSPKKGIVKDVVYFIGLEPIGDVIVQEEEVSDFVWLSYEKALEKITYDNDKKLLINAYKHLR